MKKMIDRVGICLLIAAFFWCGTLISDRQRLNRELIRLHIVAASDGAEDQARKLRVRDAVTQSLQSDLQKLTDAEQARAYLQEKLPDIQQVATRTLQNLGCQDSVRVSLCKEAFDTRVYDTFSLPSGVYQALRIVIGEGQGHNWWCVVFPGLCVPDGLNQALQGQQGYELRFGVLDALGKLENILFAG